MAAEYLVRPFPGKGPMRGLTVWRVTAVLRSGRKVSAGAVVTRKDVHGAVTVFDVVTDAGQSCKAGTRAYRDRVSAVRAAL